MAIDWSQFGTNMISSVGNGIIGGLIGLGNTALQHKYNKELSELQYQQNIASWNMQNEYNSPVAQRQRLEDAGLNPALLYGNGGGSTGNASQMPEYQAFGQSISSNMLQGAQIAQLAAQTRLTNAQAEKQERENPFVEKSIQAQIDNYLTDVDVKKTTIRQMEKGIKKMDVEINKMTEEIGLIREEINLKIAQAKTEADKQKLLEAQEALALLEQSLTAQEIKTEEERTKTQKAQTGYIEQQRATSKAQGDMYKAEEALAKQKKKTEEGTTKKVDADAAYRQWEADYVKRTGRKPEANLQQFILTTLAKVSNPDLIKVEQQYESQGTAEQGGKGKYYDPDFDFMD